MIRTLTFVSLAALGACGESSTPARDGGTGGDATGDATVDAAGDPYIARGMPGGLDRVRIWKTNDTTCVALQLVTPSSGGVGLSLPTDWGVDLAFAAQPIAACDPLYLGTVTNMFDATGQLGTVAFTGGPIPTVITNLDVTLSFVPGNPSWCPPSAQLLAVDLPVVQN
jgi:hypothetical protein